jgi:hypothetical protein
MSVRIVLFPPESRAQQINRIWIRFVQPHANAEVEVHFAGGRIHYAQHAETGNGAGIIIIVYGLIGFHPNLPGKGESVRQFVAESCGSAPQVAAVGILQRRRVVVAVIGDIADQREFFDFLVHDKIKAIGSLPIPQALVFVPGGEINARLECQRCRPCRNCRRRYPDSSGPARHRGCRTGRASAPG